jgi:hypothetical protein
MDQKKEAARRWFDRRAGGYGSSDLFKVSRKSPSHGAAAELLHNNSWALKGSERHSTALDLGCAGP